MLRPSQVDGTMPFLLLMGSFGTLLLLLWRAWRLRGRSSPGLPEEPIIPSALPQKQIHDRQYLSRLLQDEDAGDP